MAGFLRRKTKILRHDPEPAAETVNTSASSPIFARFATTFTSSGQQPRNAASPSLHGRVVSQPMALGSASPQRAVRTSHVLGESQQPPQRHNAQELPRTATHVHRKNDHPTRALSTSGSTVAQGKPERAVRPVPAFYDKPLPIPIPTDDDPSAANTLTRPQDDPTPVFQRAAVLRPLSPSHDTRPLQSAAFPPSAYETGPQLTQRRSTSVDVPQQIRRNTNVDQQVPAGMSPPDSGVPHQLRHKHDVQSLPPLPPMYARQNSNHIVNPPPQAGSTQVYNRQAYDGTPPRTSATRNESTVSSYTLRKDALMLEPKPGMRGGAIPSGGQSNSRLGGSSVYIDANGLGSTVATNGIGIRYDTKALPSRPISQGEVSNIYVDASEEPKQATPVLGAGELSPESVPNRELSTKSSPSSPDFNNWQAEQDSSLVSQSSPLPTSEDYSVARGSDTTMGVTISFPDAWDSASKYGLRTKHRLSSSADGFKMRNSYHNHDPHQPFDPYQEFDRMPQLVHSAAPVRGKPLIFAAMEANIDQQQGGEEQKVSVRVWDGQDSSFGQNMGSYISSTPTPPATVQGQRFSPLTNGGQSSILAEYPSPPSSEFSFPRGGKADVHQESPQVPLSALGAVSPKPRKLYKTRNPSVDSRHATRPLTPVKTRPLTPVSPTPPSFKKAGLANGLVPPIQLRLSLDNQEPHLEVPHSRSRARSSGMALLGVDEDPFAKTEGVTLLATSLHVKEKEKDKEKEQEKDKETRRAKLGNGETSQEWLEEESAQLKKQPSIEVDGDGIPLVNRAKADVKSEQSIRCDEKRISRTEEFEATRRSDVEARTASPLEDRPKTRANFDVDLVNVTHQSSNRRKSKRLPSDLVAFVSDARLLTELLAYLSFYDWCILASVSKATRTILADREGLREVVLERFLKTVGYTKWCWDGQDPLPLSLQDLNDYMFGVSTPTYEYARVADLYVKSLMLHPAQRDQELLYMTGRLTAATRAYSRVVLRLRAQAEKDAASRHAHSSPVPSRGAYSRPASRASSPARSSFSHGNTGSHPTSTAPTVSTGFRSPLFRPRRAPLLRVFVPSPDGDWLSDKSVLECEGECQRAGIVDMMRFGDVVWDTAVGDEGNVGRLIWDGSYLIDLDYSYSPVGDLPKYVPALAFPPSYFHKVIRTGPSTTNPIAHIDLSPWGEVIAANLQLLQDRVRTETPQGAFHNVVRWVHRSSFVIRPPSNSIRTRGSPTRHILPRIPIPGAHGLFVDPGWYGTVIIETEGTNESLADLQDRCGPGAFPPRAKGVAGQMGINPTADVRKVFRIIRERSRPGEIWIRAVSNKERLL